MYKKILYISLGIILHSITSCVLIDMHLLDVDVELSVPDEIIVINNSYVSTLRSFRVDIVRNGLVCYTLKEVCSIPAGKRESFKVDDFIILQNDKANLKDAGLSNEM